MRPPSPGNKAGRLRDPARWNPGRIIFNARARVLIKIDVQLCCKPVNLFIFTYTTFSLKWFNEIMKFISLKIKIMATTLNTGEKAPSFSAKDHEGNEISLEKMQGKKIILYFYPRDNTPGCTAEACSLRDGYDDLLSAGFSVVGVSPDSEESHQKFSKKHDLPFHLIADPEKELIKKYGAWGEKSMLGKRYMGVIRTTFIINEEGIIEHILSKVDTKNHASQILALYN